MQGAMRFAAVQVPQERSALWGPMQVRRLRKSTQRNGCIQDVGLRYWKRSLSAGTHTREFGNADLAAVRSRACTSEESDRRI